MLIVLFLIYSITCIYTLQVSIINNTFDGKISKVFFLGNDTFVHSLDILYKLPDTIIQTNVTSVDLNMNTLYIFTISEIYRLLPNDKLPSKLTLPQNTLPNDFDVPILDFHPSNPSWFILVTGRRACPQACHTTAYMTTDNAISWKQVDSWAEKCLWARDVRFQNPSLDHDAIYCISYLYKNGQTSQDRLRYSESTENPRQFVLIRNHGTSHTALIDSGVQGFFVVSNVLVVATIDGPLSKLYVSSDGLKLSLAQFPPQIQVGSLQAFTLLPSTSDGVFLDVSGKMSIINTSPHGTLFKSNQDGNFFSQSLPFTHRDAFGRVDFDQILGIEGIIHANVISNPTDPLSQRMITSVMSFDNGLTWKELNAPMLDSQGMKYACSIGECQLHIHSHTTAIGGRSLLSDYGCPGLLLGVGNVGKQLIEYTEGNVFLSRDAGVTWSEIKKEAHKWAVGDYGNIIVIVDDEQSTDHVLYSFDFGKSWTSYKFTDTPVRVDALVTQTNSTSLQFLVIGHRSSGSSSAPIATVATQLNFFPSKKCSLNQDMEKWSPRSKTHSCYLGTTLTLTRRKAESVCYIGDSFNPYNYDEKPCECNEADYEWYVSFFLILSASNFFRTSDNSKCELFGQDPEEPARCKQGDKYMGSSGYRKLTSSKCVGGVDLTPKVERLCGTTMKAGEIGVTATMFNESISNFFYYNKTGNVVIRTVTNEIYQSDDEGSTWNHILAEYPIISMFADQYRGTHSYFLSKEKTMFMSSDSGKTYSKINLPAKADLSITPLWLESHSKEESWLLYTGISNCDGKDDCHTEVYVSWDSGKSWNILRKNVLKCMWGYTKSFRSKEKDAVFCLQAPEGRDPRYPNMRGLSLIKSNDAHKGVDSFFNLFSCLNFAIFEQYILALQVDESINSIKIVVSLNGDYWGSAVFPPNFQLPETGYTILDSSSGNIFIQALINRAAGYGNLFRSNWNGTFFSLSLEAVNDDLRGHVDFEKISGIDGIAIANQVKNVKDTIGGQDKLLVTKISYDDGDTWNTLNPPVKDSRGVIYECEGCTLNLHAYTEKRDKRDLYSSSSALGFMLAVGNVGHSLSPYNDGRTYLSRDAGNSWTEITEDAYMFEFADSGSIFVLINDEVPTDTIKYSINQGNDIREIQISDKIGGGLLRVSNIITEGSATSSHLIVLGSVKGGLWDQKYVAIHLDFSKIWTRECKMNDDEAVSDFEKWSFMNGECHFGRKTDYYRRKSDRDCSPRNLYSAPKIVENACACTRADFECDFNYISNEKQECILSGNLSPPEPVCVDGKKRFTNGYIKKKISGCSGGKEAELMGRIESCGKPGGSSGSWIFTILLLLVLTVLAIIGFMYFYKDSFSNFNGSIRLPTEDGNFFNRMQDRALVAAEYMRDVALDLNDWMIYYYTLCSDYIRQKWTRQGYEPVDEYPRSSFENRGERDSSLVDLNEY